MMRAWVIAACLVSLSAVAQVDARVEITPPVIPWHRQAQLTIVVEAPDGVEVKVPSLSSEDLGGLAIAGAPRVHQEPSGDGRKRQTVTYALEALRAGVYPIKPLVFTWAGGNTLTVPAPALRVRDLTDDEKREAETFAPNDAPVDLGASWLRVLGLGAAVVGVAAALALAVWYLWRRRARKTAPAPLAPWEVAYARLRALDEAQWARQGQVQPYYVELSAILRQYIEDRFHLRAPEQTTPEFLAEAARNGAFNAVQQQFLAALLRHCDRVKFARLEPTLQDMESNFAAVLRFVDTTIPQPEPAVEQQKDVA